MFQSQKAFTMIELIFIIVIIGILGAVAVPRLMATRDDALISKNIEYIVASMQEISSYIVANGNSKDDLTEMSDMLKSLKSRDRVIVDSLNKSVKVKIGKKIDCISIDINSSDTTELLQTIFSTSNNDRICHMVQETIKEKDYPLVLRGRLIKF